MTLITAGADSRFEHFAASKIFYTEPCHHDLRNASPSLDIVPAESPALSLSAHIYHLTQNNQYGEAIYLFANMLAQGVSPDGHVLPSVIKAATGLSSFNTGT
ncbi:Pentatricopeptide repeat-containing protein At1g20230 [Linum perenne]